MKRLTIYKLIQKYQDNTATDQEKQALTDWYLGIADKESHFPDEEGSVEEEMWLRLGEEIGFVKRKQLSIWRCAAAAAILVIISAAVSIIYIRNSPAGHSVASKKETIIPGSNKAVLTLADGKKISLSDAVNGNLAFEENIEITKNAQDQLIYTVKGGASVNTDANAFNTVETPKGGQYQVKLPDGTNVWLNASSSIRFPLSFRALSERRVILTGEAYFEVAHNKSLPFRVVTGRQVTEVLGTHFNINAYGDEPDIKTTLLQGSVKLTAQHVSALLKPGQESVFSDRFKIAEVDTIQAVAWKNGYFSFDDEKLESIMRKISRWYDVKVVYEDESVKDEQYSAVTRRFSDLATLLKLMEQTGDSHFRINGTTVRIRKK